MAGPSDTLGSPWPPLVIRPFLFYAINSSIYNNGSVLIGCLVNERLFRGSRPDATQTWLRVTSRGVTGEFHDRGDAKWIVIRRSLWGPNDTPCRRPAPGRPNNRPGLAARSAYLVV
jgi:hypothetical protein